MKGDATMQHYSGWIYTYICVHVHDDDDDVMR